MSLLLPVVGCLLKKSSQKGGGAQAPQDPPGYTPDLGVKTCDVFLCFVAIVRVRVYYVDFTVFFALRHW